MTTYTSAPIVNPFFAAKGAEGSSLAGGLVYLYYSGTDLPLTTYTDYTLTTPNPWPVVLNAQGYAPIWITPGVPFKIRLDDINGVQQPNFPVDMVQSAPSSALPFGPIINYNNYNNLLPPVDPTTGTQFIYTLYMNQGSGVYQIQRRDLKSRVNHTFQVYANIPSSIISTFDSGQTVDSWIYQINGNIYLNVVQKLNNTLNSAGYPSVNLASVYLLQLVDVSNNGTFTQIVSMAQPGTSGAGLAYGNLTDGAFFGGEIFRQYSHGIYNGYMAYEYGSTPHTPTGLINLRATLTGVLFTTSYYYNDFQFKTQTPQVTETAQGQIMSNYGVTKTAYKGGISDTLGNSVGIVPSVINPGSSTIVYGVVGGQLIILNTVKFMHPVSFTNGSGFGIATYTIGTYNSVVTLTEIVTDSPTTTIGSYLDQSGAQRTLNLPTANGSDPLVGIWGNSKAGVYQIYATIAGGTLSYSNFYVVNAGDYTDKYSIFSQLQGDGTIVHIEGIENPTPTLWSNNTFVMNLN